MTRLFGTDGIRGVANITPMTAETALAVGRAAAHISKSHDNRHRIVIGKDTRLSGYMIENALTAGICSMGVDVLLVGPLPTPGIAFITLNMRADAGIVISASHNPYQDNGIKIFSSDGTKLSYNMEDEIETLISSGHIDDVRPTATDIGKAYRIDDALGRYIVFCKNTFPKDLTLDGLKIVIDCANGATYKAAPAVFTELGAEVTVIHDSPDGKNINDNCGSQFTDDLSAAVLEHNADAGFAFDGDGDRLIAIDENGRELTGDHLLTLCAAHLKEEKRLENDLVILTPMSNFGVRSTLDGLGISHHDADVGDRNVLELMQKENAALGGEQSGHMIFRQHHTTGDGIISALQVLAAMTQSGRPISELANILTLAPQRLINVNIASKPPIEEVPALTAAIKKAEDELDDQGRVLVRYSGTEALCRVMVEGPSEEITERLSGSIADVVKSELG
jgi:phosphoglucosamine mutase